MADQSVENLQSVLLNNISKLQDQLNTIAHLVRENKKLKSENLELRYALKDLRARETEERAQETTHAHMARLCGRGTEERAQRVGLAEHMARLSGRIANPTTKSVLVAEKGLARAYDMNEATSKELERIRPRPRPEELNSPAGETAPKRAKTGHSGN